MQDVTQKDTPTDVTLEIASELEAWRTRVMNVLLTVISLVAAPAVAVVIVEAARSPEQWPAALVFVAIYLFIVALAVWRRLAPGLRAWCLLLLGYTAGVLAFARGGLAGDGPMYMLALPVLATILIGARSGLVMTIFSLLTFSAFAVAAHLGWLANWLIIPDNPLTLAGWMSKGTTFAMLLVALMVLQWLFSRSQARTLHTSTERATALGQAHALLQERAEELDRHARQFEAIVRVSHDTTALLEAEEMLQRTTESIKEQFGFNTVAVYLADEASGEISLRAIAGATPEAGARPEQLETAAQAIRSGESHIIQPSAEETWPGMGRLVLPLRVRDQTIGALAVQTREYAAFGDEDVTILQMMADQIAIAIENTRLFDETQASLRELDALYRQYAAESWQQYTRAKPETMRYSYGSVTCPAQTWQAAREQARASGEAVTFTGDNGSEGAIQSLAMPVGLRGLTIGVLGFHRPAEAGAWQPEEIAMVRMVADRLALALENVRLLEEAQRRAHEEHILGEVTARIRAPMDVETILQTAVRELGQAMGVDRVSIYPILEEEAA
jgi:GAF domain-containing protein